MSRSDSAVSRFKVGQRVRFLRDGSYRFGWVDRVGRKYIYVETDEPGRGVEPFFTHALQLQAAVTDLYVNCSFPLRPDAVALSDCCQQPATVAVASGGNRLYRCPLHQGQINARTRGVTHTHVWRSE